MESEATAAKNRGNQFFAKKDWQSAIKEFSDAIKFDPTDHVFYSNRSACFLELDRFEEALEDAKMCIALKPDWAKGYSRKGHALYKIADFEKSAEAYKTGLEKDPSNSILQEGLALAQQRLAEKANADPFAGPPGKMNMFDNLAQKISADPELSGYMKDPDFASKIAQIQRDPSSFATHLNDPKVMKIMGLLLREMGVHDDSSSMPSFDSDSHNTNKPNEADTAKESKSAEQIKAEEEKIKGNEAYKIKKFDEAIEHYSKAFELDPTNIVLLTNRAAVYMTMREFEKAKEDCLEAVKVGRQEFSSFKLIAKALARLGDISVKEGKLEEAIKLYKDSLVESNEYAVKRRMREVEERLEEIKKKNYIDPQKALEHKEKGNEFFKQSKWQEALSEYSESLKRNPSDHKVYCNRAAVYSKLMAWEYALNDCKKCIEIDKTFSKAYLRKGKIEHLLKNYQGAIMSFNEGLKYEPHCQQLKDAKQATMMAVIAVGREGKFDDEHRAKAMLDPTVQQLMNDPAIREVLETMKTNSFAAQAALSDPEVMQKLEILMAAGVVQFG